MTIRLNWENIGIGFGIGALVLFFGWGVIYVAYDMATQAECAELGWANHSVTYKFDTYCIREENEYEITTPLSELR